MYYMAHAKLGSPESTQPRLGCTEGRHHRLVVGVSIIGVALAVGLAVSVAIAVVGRSRLTSGGRPSTGRAPTEAITRTCGVTLYPELCISALMGLPGAASAGNVELVPMSLNMTHQRVVDALYNATGLGGAAALLAGARARAAYGDCLELLEAAAELLALSVGVVAAPPASPDSTDSAAADMAGQEDDVMTWLSAALTNHDTCYDSLQEVGADDDEDGRIKPWMLGYLSNLGEHLSNSLAIYSARGRPDGDLSGVPVHNQLHRRLLTSDDNTGGDDVSFPRWVTHNDRRLLQAAAADIEPDMVVAKDGSGTHRKLRDAIKAAPDRSHRRVVIYVKAGVYIENVKVARKKTNLMLVGDGVGKTVVVGYRSVHDNYTTFHTATLAVAGAGLIMRDMTVENRAGPAKHQAVALLVSGDHAVVYRCAVLGYQDTLYAHAQRQFYRDCDVAGTVDFVFGNAAVVLQNCTLWARRPLPQQKNTVTAQGRRDPNQSTGISVHGCRLLPAPELVPVRRSYPTYLGRPWKPYARAVYMMSYMADHVHAAGWLAWDASGRAPDTLYYGEYRNYGPGAAVGRRVAWPGHRVIKLPEEAMEFTVGRFIGGYSWLPPTGVAFVAGLTV